MLGSEPFVINDIHNACQLNPAPEPTPDENREITGYFDLIGRRIAAPRIGEVYVVRYRHGWSGLRVRGE